jgi:hypothetical protein
MKRILIGVLVLASFFMFGPGSKPGSGIGATVATASCTTDCDEKDWICGEPFKDEDGQWYQWCHCPGNGLLIRRPAF